MAEKSLRRSREHNMIAGVIGGFAKYFDLDVTMLRIIYVVGSVISVGFPGILVYLLCWIVMPLEDKA